MFVINANNQQQTDYVSGAKYGFEDGYYSFFINDGRGGAPYCLCGFGCNIYSIGDFKFTNYDIVLTKDYYFGGMIYGCGGRTSCGSHGEWEAVSIASGNLSHAYVSRHQFTGGEIVGKEVLSNDNMLAICISNGYGFTPDDRYDYELGLVHTDGTKSCITSCSWIHSDNDCYCGKKLWSNLCFATLIPEVHGGEGVVACKGDRIYICYNILRNCECNGTLNIGLMSIPNTCLRNGYCAYDDWRQTWLIGFCCNYLCSPRDWNRAKPIQISVE